MDAYTIQAQDLSFSFGEGNLKKQILFNVSLCIEPGEIVLLTGPSGSGKTTLLTLIGGLRRVQQGTLTVLDFALHQAAESTLVAVRRQIGFIFQQHHLLPFLTVRRNVALMLDLQTHMTGAHVDKTVHAMLREVGLEAHADVEPLCLSGGQQQRVAIARALVGGPKLILADEPTAALDGKAGRHVVNLLKHLAKHRQASVLMVTHDSRILDIADRVLAMEDGVIV